MSGNWHTATMPEIKEAMHLAIEKCKGDDRPFPRPSCQHCGQWDVHMAWCPEVRHLYDRKDGVPST